MMLLAILNLFGPNIILTKSLIITLKTFFLFCFFLVYKLVLFLKEKNCKILFQHLVHFETVYFSYNSGEIFSFSVNRS